MTAVFDYIISAFLTIGMFFNILPTILSPAPLYGPEEDGVLLNCVAVSDTHFDNNYFRDRTNIMRRVCLGIGKCSSDIDVLMNIGDITNSGSVNEYRHAKLITNTYVKPKNYVACMGNHDSWNGSADPDYDKAKSLFLKHLKDFDIQTDRVYYEKEVNGYHFICLGTEDLDIDGQLPLYSEEQLKWFDDTLAEAVKSQKPVFVLSHRPLQGHNGLTNDYYLPAETDSIMNKYATEKTPILFFSGHCHTFNQERAFDKGNNVYYLNLPSTEYNDSTIGEPNDKGGMGVVMEVYADKILIKYRDFISGQYIDGFRYEIEL